MKSILTATFVITCAISAFAFKAQALVLPNPGFNSQQCGPQTIDTAHKDTRVMQAACVGIIGKTKERAVQFTLSDDATYLFKVVSQNNMMMALQNGSTMVMFRLIGEDGEVIAMKAILNHDGSVKSVSGVFQTNSYLVPSFAQIITMM